MKIEFVRADVLLIVQSRLIDNYGGLAGVRDEGALESATARPRNLEREDGSAVDRGARRVPRVGAGTQTCI